MVFLFNDVNSNVRIVTTILKVRLANNLMILTETPNEQSREEVVLTYDTPSHAKKDLKKLVEMMKDYYMKNSNMQEPTKMGFNLTGNQEVLCESEEDDYYEE